MKIGITAFVTDEGISGPKLGVALKDRGFDRCSYPTVRISPRAGSPRPPGEGESPREHYRALDPFVILGAIAAATERLILGTGVTLLIQREVVHAAKEVAMLDRISRGRFVFGVGAGWNREDGTDHGTDPSTRGALLDEQSDAIRAIWTRTMTD